MEPFFRFKRYGKEDSPHIYIYRGFDVGGV